MNRLDGWKTELLRKGIMAAAAFLSCMAGYRGHYPLLSAVFGAYCLLGRRSRIFYLGLVLGLGAGMGGLNAVKCLLTLGIIWIAVKAYARINKGCDGWIAGILTGLSVIVMDLSGMLLGGMDRTELLLGLMDGLAAAGGCVLIHYICEMAGDLGTVRRMSCVPEERILPQRQEAFAVAVDGLSRAFCTMDMKTEDTASRRLESVQREITGRMCAACSDCAVCWEENRFSLADGIRNLVTKVMAQENREELYQRQYVKECHQYNDMVREAVEAVGRIELNEAWYRRLRENRLIIAQQLNAMSDLLHSWGDDLTSCDAGNRLVMARLIYEAKERGLLAENVHFFQDQNGRLRIRVWVHVKWNGGIPVKNLRLAAEKACGIPLRIQKDARSILTRTPSEVWLFEETNYYTLPGIAIQKKNDSPVSGDSFLMFETDEGRYHICLSDGMGSGSDARRESETVVELMEKFLEAGFEKETAIKMMNSAMVLQGTKESYSTLDHGQIDLYTGQMEMIKVGAAVSFLKRKEKVDILYSDTLPAGFDVNQELKSTKISMCTGDFLVMVTDGVLEYLHTENPAVMLAEIIQKIQTDNAGVLAKEILEAVAKNQGGYAMDDMTVLTTGIWARR